MSEPKKMGRPKLPTSEVRKVVPLRLSAKEHAMMIVAAEAKMLGLGNWMRTVLTSAAAETIRKADGEADGVRTRNSPM